MSNTDAQGISSMTSFPARADSVDLAGYNLFARETLKPTSDTMSAFRNREGIQSCERCIRSHEMCVPPEGGRSASGVRCAFCSRRRLVCSWRADILIPATALHYGISAEEATRLYEKWADESAQTRTSTGGKATHENTPFLTSRPPPPEFQTELEDASMENDFPPFPEDLQSDTGTNFPTTEFAGTLEPQHLRSGQLPDALSGPPSLARKAGKLNAMIMHYTPPEPLAEIIIPTPPPKRGRGRPRKSAPKPRKTELKVEEVDNTDALRSKRETKLTPKAQATSHDPMKKPSTRSGSKRKHDNMESALEEPPPKRRGRPPKVRITIPARNSSRLKKNTGMASISSPGSVVEMQTNVDSRVTFGATPGSTFTQSFSLGKEANLPDDLEARYIVLEERYIKLCDIYAQSMIEAKEKDQLIRRLEESNQNLEHRLKELTVD